LQLQGRAHARWPLLGLLIIAAAAPPGLAQGLGNELTVGGSLAVTSDYIYRGVSESGGDPAGQVDLHARTTGGTYFGAWSSTREASLDPYANFDLELYLGHRFDLNNDWGVTVEGRAHYYLGGDQETNDDYQQVSTSLTYQDRWTLSVTAIPNAVRYWYDNRLGRSAAWAVDTTGQWLLFSGIFLTGGAGYYYSTGTGPGIEGPVGYAYGSVGLAFEYRRWRADVGYFATQDKARELFPYPMAKRFAGTLLWRF
jgi:uncharacterized protein (TIGR02001 family)